MTTILMFPGQSSLRPDMLAQAEARFPKLTTALVRRAEARLGRDLSPWRTRIEPKCNQDVQLAVFLTTHIHLQAYEDEGGTAVASLGLSLGEYNHLVHIGAIDFEDAVALVAARGEAYDRGPEGRMAAVFPLPLDELQPMLDRAQVHGTVEPVNLNSPSQTVIAGDVEAVEAAVALIEDETFAMVHRLAGRIPMHASTFRPVAEAFRPALEAAPWRSPGLTYRPNVYAIGMAQPSPATITRALERHVYSPVRWCESIDCALADHPRATLLEIGPGHVLTRLLRAPWPAAQRCMTRLAVEATHGR